MATPKKPQVRELTPLEYLRVQARKNQARVRVPKPEMIAPDAMCFAYDRPKAAFFTEGKAYEALVVAQKRREIEGNPQHEKRFYRCPHGRNLSRLAETHFHLTSMEKNEYEEVCGDVSQD